MKLIEIVTIFDLLFFGKTANNSTNTRTTAFLNQKDITHTHLNLLSHSGTHTLLPKRKPRKKIFLSTHLLPSTVSSLLLKTSRKVELSLSLVPL